MLQATVTDDRLSRYAATSCWTGMAKVDFFFAAPEPLHRVSYKGGWPVAPAVGVSYTEVSRGFWRVLDTNPIESTHYFRKWGLSGASRGHQGKTA